MRRAAAALALLALAGCGGDDSDRSPPRPALTQLTLESPAFAEGGRLPKRFTCDGRGASPPLRWSGVPDGTQDLALLVEDPDVPVSAFLHWAMWKLPFEPDGGGRVLEDNVAPEVDQGLSDAGARGWEPACPPDGRHRYVFRLFALERGLDLPKGAPGANVRAAIAATGVLEEARLEVTYGR
jgi:Raf kinase inhibitor-like YbhB/YbcL family protein